MSYQSLYRRYRPAHFAEIRGQEHVVTALRNAVAQGLESHAYLFSGPRGTGKTSTARIFAKALNCTNLTDGEPCCECESCLSMEAGTSYDLFELDAASNNGVEAMRSLIGQTAVASPGRTKVYILDEVHMLSPAASNALLKTLEEPPEHVKFVLATTDPQKVLPTIRSRTQHFEFGLLSADQLSAYVDWIITDAALDVPPESVGQIVRDGRGSARDTLSALDLAVASGGQVRTDEPVSDLLDGLATVDIAGAMGALAAALASGREPRIIAESIVSSMRNAFLAAVGADLSHLSGSDAEQVAALAKVMGTPRVTRAMELVGSALVDMRQAADPRIPLEVALIRICDGSGSEGSGDAHLSKRVSQLEVEVAALRSGEPAAQQPAAQQPAARQPPVATNAPAGAQATPAGERPAAQLAEQPADDEPVDGAPTNPREARAQLREQLGGSSGKPAPRKTPGAQRAPAQPPASTTETKPAAPQPAAETPAPLAPPAAPQAAAETPAPPAPSEPPADPGRDAATPDPSPAAPVVSSGAASPTVLSIESCAAALHAVVENDLKGIAKAIYSGGEITGVSGTTIQLTLQNAPTLNRAVAHRETAEAALTQRLGTHITFELVDASTPAGSSATREAASSSATPSESAPQDAVEVADANTGTGHDDEAIDVTQLEDADVASGVDKLTEAFPGAEIIEEETT